jgi:uncharacterized membrane protein YoaK (UPF0700 family)
MRRRLEWVLGLTSFAAGTVDVASFAKLDGVLASAMTGNLALLGLYLGRGSAGAALNAAVALAAFILGAGTGAWATRERAQGQALKLLLTAETLLLTGAAGMWLASGRPSGGVSGLGVISLLAMAMGLQIIAGRQLNLASVPTVVFTSTLANLVTSVTHGLARKIWRLPPDAWRQARALALYFCGALIAGICVYAGTPVAMILPAASIGAALAILLYPVRQVP